MSAKDKTASLKRIEVPVGKLHPNPDNPNVMGERTFNMLIDNIQMTGFTDPILVRPFPKKKGHYEIVGGEHRWKAAKYLGFVAVPCTVVTDKEFDEERAAFQLVRHNVISGKLDPAKFVALYNKVSEKYAEDVAREMFGFAEEAEFRRLIRQTEAGLPPELKQKFKEEKVGVKTVQDLASLLNNLFSRYGDTLPYGYMLLDYGGKQTMWIRVSKKTMTSLETLGNICADEKRTMDDVLGNVIARLQTDAGEDWLDHAVKHTKGVVIPEGLPVAPTKENIEKFLQV
jgi:ParB/RepB/Spo0J family partition protein